MMQLAEDASRARLDAATALLEACEGRHFTATQLRSAYLFDVFVTVPEDMVEMADQLDRGVR